MVAQALTVLPVDDALTGVEPDGFATCPTCDVVDSALTNASLAAGAHWRCGRCGQMWDQKKIATVTAYNAWDSARQRAKPSAQLVYEWDGRGGEGRRQCLNE